MSQGQARVIICIILVVLAYPMLHTKFQGQGLICSGGEDFLRFVTCKEVTVVLIMWPELFKQVFVPPDP